MYAELHRFLSTEGPVIIYRGYWDGQKLAVQDMNFCSQIWRGRMKKSDSFIHIINRYQNLTLIFLLLIQKPGTWKSWWWKRGGGSRHTRVRNPNTVRRVGKKMKIYFVVRPTRYSYALRWSSSIGLVRGRDRFQICTSYQGLLPNKSRIMKSVRMTSQNDNEDNFFLRMYSVKPIAIPTLFATFHQ